MGDKKRLRIYYRNGNSIQVYGGGGNVDSCVCVGGGGVGVCWGDYKKKYKKNIWTVAEKVKSSNLW